MINAYLREKPGLFSQPKSLGSILSPFGAHGPVTFLMARLREKAALKIHYLARIHSSSNERARRKIFFHKAHNFTTAPRRFARGNKG